MRSCSFAASSVRSEVRPNETTLKLLNFFLVSPGKISVCVTFSGRASEAITSAVIVPPPGVRRDNMRQTSP